MDLGITGKTAIICASSKGLGKACALSLAAEGAKVIINGRSKDSLEKTADEIRSTTNSDVITVAADVTTEEGRAALLETCLIRTSS